MADGSPRRDGDATRERLMRAALDLYTGVGFLRTTTPSLAERAGVAEGTIYRHFSSKEHLLNEVYRRALRWALDALAVLEGDRVRKVRDRLAVLGRQITATAAQDPALIRMLLVTTVEPFLDDASRDIRREWNQGLTLLVAMGKSDGQVRSGPAELWAQVWLLVVGLAAERVAAGDWTAESPTVSMTLEAAWHAIAAHPASVEGRPAADEDRRAPGVP